MYNFFLTITITAGVVTVIILYYTVRNVLRRKRNRKMAAGSWRKLYTDEENFIRSHFRTLLLELTSGKIQWIIFQSKLKPSARFEITFSTLRTLIEIIFIGRELSDREEKYLLNLGVDRYQRNTMNNVIQCGSNSKIICDVIFYLMDKVFEVKNIKKINLKVSGG